MLSGRPSLAKILNDLLMLKAELNAEGRFPLAIGRRVTGLVAEAREFLADINADAKDLVRIEFSGNRDALQLLDLLTNKMDADSLLVGKLITEEMAEKLSGLLQNVPSDIDESIFTRECGTVRVNKAEAEADKPFLQGHLSVKPAEYFARRSVSTFFATGELPKQEEQVPPLRACARAMLELAALEGKKGSRTGNIASYMSKTKTLREAYAKLDDAEKAVFDRALDNSGVKKIVDAIVDKNNSAPQSNKAVALWTAIRKNEDVKARLTVLLAEKKVKRSSAPVFGSQYN